MLMSFRFANHRSFRDEQQLNLTSLPDVESGSPEVGSPVAVAGVFGANASGKSNLLAALTFMRRLVLSSDREVEPDIGLRRDPFRLDPEVAAEPSRYVVDLLLNGIRHTYGFSLDGERVLEEWLYAYRGGNEPTPIFEREGDDFTWSESYRHSYLVTLEGITAPTALFLSVATRFEGKSAATGANAEARESISGVYSWFLASTSMNTMVRRRMAHHLSRQLASWMDDESRRATFVELLRAADVGLVDVTIDRPAQGALLSSQDVSPSPPDQNLRSLAHMRRGVDEPRLLFAHRGAATDVLLDLDDESAGTRQLLELAVLAVAALDDGTLLYVDEIDASLHPILTAKLISLFQNPLVNKKAAQLLFTTHDSSLLGHIDGEEVLHRDQIWFVEKDQEGASVLFPLLRDPPEANPSSGVWRLVTSLRGESERSS